MAKSICCIQYTKKCKSWKNGNKDGKALYKLMNNTVYGKKMKNLRNRIDVKLVSNKKDYLKWTFKPSYMFECKRQNYINAYQTCIHWNVNFGIK